MSVAIVQYYFFSGNDYNMLVELGLIVLLAAATYIVGREIWRITGMGVRDGYANLDVEIAAAQL